MHTTDPFVAALAEMPRTFANILATHLRDEHGRCEGCALDPRLRKRWPCVLRTAAVQAQQHHLEVRAGAVTSAA